MIREKCCVAVANLGTRDVKLRPQWKVAKVYCRKVTGTEEGNYVATDEVLAQMAREFRKKLGMRVNECRVDAEQLEKLDHYEYSNVLTEDEQELGCATGVEHEIHLTSDMPIRLP